MTIQGDSVDNPMNRGCLHCGGTHPQHPFTWQCRHCAGECRTSKGGNMNHPVAGETLYIDAGEDAVPVKVIRVEGTIVWYVPIDTEIQSTHQGNLYDANGKRRYAV